MNRESRWLIVILGVMTVSVLITGGLVAYLALTTARENEQVPNVAEDVQVIATADDATGESRIAFISDQEGDAAVYVMDADGSNRQRVSGDNLHVCLYPSWSPDGQRVAYWGTEENSFKRSGAVAEVWVSAIDGSEHTRVNHDVSSVSTIIPPAWSPDGARLAFVAAGDSSSAIYIALADGSGIEQIIPLPWELQYLAWSPAGDALLFVSKTLDAGSVYVWPSESDEIIEVFHDAEAADWSPNGAEILIGDTAERVASIMEQNGEPRPVAEFGAGLPLAATWSPDDTWVAVGTSYSRVRGRSFGLYFSDSLHVITIEGGEIVTIVEGEGRIHHLDWSPDGSRLLFTLVDYRGRSGSDVPYANLWSYDVAFDQLEQVTEESGFAGCGVWSP